MPHEPGRIGPIFAAHQKPSEAGAEKEKSDDAGAKEPQEKEKAEEPKADNS